MGLVIPITGVAQDFRVPGSYAEILFAQGPASAASPSREVVLVMPMISTGTWTPGTLYPIVQASDAENGGGPGSPIHRGARMFLRANKDCKLWGLPVAETTGGSPVAATRTTTYANAATAQGTAVETICGEDCSFTFKAGDTAISIATGMVAAINAKTWLPVTAASGGTAVVTQTAKLKGISQGTATLGVIRARSAITAGVGTTATASGAFLGTGVTGAEGSTTEAANLATALANIAVTRKYYVVTHANDATSLANLKSHIALKSAPRTGLRSVGFGAYAGTKANAVTLSNSLNYERIAIAHQVNSEHDSAELAAQVAAIRQKREQVDSAFNFNTYNGEDWFILPAFSNADWPSPDDQNDLINGGLTCIASNDFGSYLVMSCNTRSKNAAGTVTDFRATRTPVVSVADDFTDETLVDWALNYSNKKFRDDQRLADGTVNPNQKRTRNVVVPSQISAGLARRVDEFFDDGKLQNPDDAKASIQAVKTNARAELGMQIEVISMLDQLTLRIAEVSTG